MVEEGGTNGIPLAYDLLDVGVNLGPSIRGKVWAANPGAKCGEK